MNSCGESALARTNSRQFVARYPGNIRCKKKQFTSQNGSFYFSKFYFKQDAHTFSSQTILEMGESFNLQWCKLHESLGDGVSYNLHVPKNASEEQDSDRGVGVLVAPSGAY